ncbi:MAG TPA: diguanylate cyclase [Desulfuromonadales bacterium]|nr:diguanylate cyclase [Desulfuromonadales bacterium]
MSGLFEQFDISLLYVEDEPTTREQLSAMLAHVVRTLYVAPDGSSGLELFSAHVPDVVVTDILMPGIDGLEMSRRIRIIDPDAQIIVLTAYYETEHLLQCISTGITHFIHKPVDIRKLMYELRLCNDYIQMKRCLQKQEDQIRLLSQAMEQAPILFVMTALDGTIEYVNEMFCTVTGFDKQDVIGQTPRILRSGFNSPELYQELWGTIKAGKEWEGELTNRRKDGQIYWESVRISPMRDSHGCVTKYLKVALDVTDRKMYEENLHYLSTHDSLTALYNRVYFDAEMRRLAASREFPVSIIVADIDGLKIVNDTYGHDAGDQLIRTVADTLISAFRASDVVSRIGGDEFAVLLPGADQGTVKEAVDRISGMFELHRSQLQGGGLSLGFATAECGEALTACLKQADEQMYIQKYSKRR